MASVLVEKKTSWFLAPSRASGQSVSGRFSHLNLFVVIFWIPIFYVPARNALGVQKFPPELGGVIHQQIFDLFVCVNPFAICPDMRWPPVATYDPGHGIYLRSGVKTSLSDHSYRRPTNIHHGRAP